MPEYRKAVDISRDKADEAFEMLPISILGKVSQDKPLYEDKNFKNAPKWPSGSKLTPCLNMLLLASDGHTLHQKNLKRHMAAWVKDNQLGFNDDVQDEIVLSIRALLCQLCNHKTKDRTVFVDCPRVCFVCRVFIFTFHYC